MKTSIFSPFLFLPIGPAKAAIHFKHFLPRKTISPYLYNKSIHRKLGNINDFRFLGNTESNTTRQTATNSVNPTGFSLQE